MKKSKVGYLIIAFLLVWALAQFFFLPATCSAESAYMITESELVTLEQNSTRQLAISSKLALELQIAREQLMVSDQELTEAKLQINQLQKQLTESGSLVEETGRIAAENLEILATVRARGSAGDRSQD
ncbi:hypothetical protein [Phascolarctobacterium faecium]|uniref:hypothetical protein n=1 Tax=Phascolarctobacterium faecium TaxID=33025 RepID=UPI00300ECB83